MIGVLRAHHRRRAACSRDDGPRLGLIGFDVSGRRGRGRAWISWPVIVAALLLALGIAALRVDLIRMRYALADGLATEQRLLEEQRELTAEMRRLRDPSALAKQAHTLGFVHPERVIDLPLDDAGASPGTGSSPATGVSPAPGVEPHDTTLALGVTRP